MRCRLLGVDTPERGQTDYDTATVMLETLLIEQQDDEGFIDIITRGTGKYGRWLVEVEGVNNILAETWPYDK
jgi:endonuclease YncB( thermonuclease family)